MRADHDVFFLPVEEAGREDRGDEHGRQEGDGDDAYRHVGCAAVTGVVGEDLGGVGHLVEEFGVFVGFFGGLDMVVGVTLAVECLDLFDVSDQAQSSVDWGTRYLLC